jgi:hypothetical protein
MVTLAGRPISALPQFRQNACACQRTDDRICYKKGCDGRDDGGSNVPPADVGSSLGVRARQSGLSQNPPVIAVIARYAIEPAARARRACKQLIQFDRHLYKTAPFCELCLPQTSLCSEETSSQREHRGVEHGWSDDGGLWTAAWRATANRKRTRDSYPGIA